MPKDYSQKAIFSINISDLSGIYHAIAEKANVNGGETLEGKEINLFYEAKNTIDKNKSIFTFDGKTYDERGDLYTGEKPLIAENDATYVKPIWIQKTPKNFFEAELKKRNNDTALQQIDEYIAIKKEEHQKTVQRIASSWAKQYKIDNVQEMEKFTERLYDYIKELKVTKTIDGITEKDFQPSVKYPVIEDQIVDELCGLFANESGFDPKRINSDSGMCGIFQAGQGCFADLKQRKMFGKLKPITKSEFLNLSRLEQLEYFFLHIKNCKINHSNLSPDEQISPAQVYAMNWQPWAGDPNRVYNGKKAISYINDRKNVIKIKMSERNK